MLRYFSISDIGFYYLFFCFLIILYNKFRVLEKKKIALSGYV